MLTQTIVPFFSFLLLIFGCLTAEVVRRNGIQKYLASWTHILSKWPSLATLPRCGRAAQSYRTHQYATVGDWTVDVGYFGGCIKAHKGTCQSCLSDWRRYKCVAA